MRIILKALSEHNEASDFKEPVDWKGMNLTDYPTIVKRPMDLGTIDRNLKNERYEIVEEILDHIQLVWDNCKLYNYAGSVPSSLTTGILFINNRYPLHLC